MTPDAAVLVLLALFGALVAGAIVAAIGERL